MQIIAGRQTHRAYLFEMKIIAGERKGHSIKTPEGKQTRPTLSRVREALFSIIAGDIPGSVFCELFAGSGVIGLEALSRGAKHAIMVEQNRQAIQCLQDNVKRLRYEDQATVVRTDVYSWKPPTNHHSPDIVFADPPYDSAELSRVMSMLQRWPLKPDTLVIVQSAASSAPETTLRHLRTTKYGNSALHFYLVEDNQPETGAADQPSMVSR